MESLKNLISEGEHQKQDFKFRIDDQKKIARTLAAFANTDGGRLLIGVKDNGKITGINPEEEYHMIEGAAELFCKPAVTFTHKIWQEDLKLVLEIGVSANPLRNHTAQDEQGAWKIYIRRDDHTLLANKILLKVWKLEQNGKTRPTTLDSQALSVLQAVDAHPEITLSQLYKITQLPKKTVDHYLALFVYWKNISMHVSSEGVSYTINQKIAD
jgi:predicted HTH transcriptional regulator